MPPCGEAYIEKYRCFAPVFFLPNVNKAFSTGPEKCIELPSHANSYMGLEQEIKQPNFRNDQQKAIINVIFTYNWLIEGMKRHLDHFDLTLQQFNILRILRGAKGPLSTLQIRERMLDKMSDTSRIVDRLILKELVQKNTCPHDKRLVDVTISAKGMNLLSELDGHIDEFDNVIGNLSKEETRQLNYLLDKVRNTKQVAEPARS